MSTNQLNKIAADRALIEAARGLITCQGTEQADGIIHMMLYEEESQGLEGPEKVSTRWPAHCHVTRR